MKTPEEFFKSVIGYPWANGANGPEAYDCWGLVRAYYREVRDVHLPVVAVDATRAFAVAHAFAGHAELGNWEPVEFPSEGCAVLMGQARRPHHVGLWLGGGVLHSSEGCGVTYVNNLMLKHSGWNVLGSYRLK
jgi:cell wall-associated NlpC family hydrolase